MDLSKLEVYEISMTLSDKVYHLVLKWSIFDKDTVGKQLVRSSDSVSANISEGYGRYYFKDSKVFLYHARGSLYETKTWIQKAFSRKLIDQAAYSYLNESYTRLGVKLNNYINSIGKSPPPNNNE